MMALVLVLPKTNVPSYTAYHHTQRNIEQYQKYPALKQFSHWSTSVTKARKKHTEMQTKACIQTHQTIRPKDVAYRFQRAWGFYNMQAFASSD